MVLNNLIQVLVKIHRTGHRSNVLFQYKNPSVPQASKVSLVLGGQPCTSKKDIRKTKASNNGGPSVNLLIVDNSTFHDCDVKVIINQCNSDYIKIC